MLSCKADILGIEYEVKVGKCKELKMSKDFSGQCCPYLKEIHIEHSMRGCDTKQERNGRTRSVVAHEVFHAYVHESGLELPEDVEERLAVWYQTMWDKMGQTVQDICNNIPFDKEDK